MTQFILRLTWNACYFAVNLECMLFCDVPNLFCDGQDCPIKNLLNIDVFMPLNGGQAGEIEDGKNEFFTGRLLTLQDH